MTKADAIFKENIQKIMTEGSFQKMHGLFTKVAGKPTQNT